LSRAYYKIDFPAAGLKDRAEAQYIAEGMKKIGGPGSRTSRAVKIWRVYTKVRKSLVSQFHGFTETEHNGVTVLEVV
jgi:hypothetical protein